MQIVLYHKTDFIDLNSHSEKKILYRTEGKLWMTFPSCFNNWNCLRKIYKYIMNRQHLKKSWWYSLLFLHITFPNIPSLLGSMKGCFRSDLKGKKVYFIFGKVKWWILLPKCNIICALRNCQTWRSSRRRNYIHTSSTALGNVICFLIPFLKGNGVWSISHNLDIWI